jgi:hypothetical protein
MLELELFDSKEEFQSFMTSYRVTTEIIISSEDLKSEIHNKIGNQKNLILNTLHFTDANKSKK